MKHSFKRYLTACFIITLSSCVSSQLTGEYIGGSSVWGYRLKLLPDGNFVIVFQSHLAVDTISGTYSAQADSIYFRYHYSKTDSIVAPSLAKHFNISLERALIANYENKWTLSAELSKRKIIYKGLTLKR